MDGDKGRLPSLSEIHDVNQLREVVTKKVAEYDPTKLGEEGSEFNTTEEIGLCTLMMRYASFADKLIWFIGILCVIAFGSAMPGFSVIFGDMIDSLGGGVDGFDSLKTQAIYMLYIGVGVFFVATGFSFLLALFADRNTFKIRIRYFDAVLKKDSEWFDANNPTEMGARISKETSAIQRGIGQKIGMIVMGVASFFFGYAFAFIWGWKLTLILLAAFPVMAFAGGAMGLLLESGVKDQMRAYAQSAGYAEQALQAIKVVHTYGQELLENEVYQMYLHRVTSFGKKQVFKNALGQAVMYSLFAAFYSYSFYFGGLLKQEADAENVNNKDYSGGKVIAIFFSVMIGSFMVGSGFPHMKAVSEAKIAGKLTFEVLDHVPGVQQCDPKAKMATKETLHGQIEFKNVNFRYPTRKELHVLKDFSCVFEKGKTTALVGPSGSGKSTIIQLLERFYDPTSGEILLDGECIKSYQLNSVRRLIGYVGQEPVLFNTTIRENMLYAKPDATDEEIKEALVAANAWQFITEKMSQTGLDTQVGTAGGSLSGGQKQRIAIARAFLKKPRILLLDEATSALDKTNEKAVQDAIDNYRKTTGDITIIVIAHRLSTIQDADKIVVIKNGVLEETGNHDELMTNYPEGIYAGFCAKQQVAESNEEEKAGEDAVVDAEKKETAGGEKDTNEMDKEMKAKVDAADKAYDDKVAEEAKKLEEVGNFSKLMPYNKPAILIFVGCIGAACNGAIQPLTGIILSKLLSVMTMPRVLLQFKAAEKGIEGYTVEDYFMDEVVFWCIVMLCLAGGAFLSSVIQKSSFGALGENVTLSIRRLLYANILSKNIGWFDDRENSPGVLTSAMATDTSIINGVSTESLSPQLEGGLALVVGLVFGFVWCWQMSLVMLACTPILAVGGVLEMEFQKGVNLEENDNIREANLLCGDAILNYRTVQSFGYEHLVVETYRKLLYPGQRKQTLR